MYIIYRKMKTIKRKNRSNKRRKMFTRSRKNTPIAMRRGGDPPRRSDRHNPDALHIEAHPLGGESNRMNISDQTIYDFINYYIKPNTPVIISLPVYPERHAFVVLVLENKQKIMLADWVKRNLDDLEDNDDWKIYVKFMKMLQEKYRGYTLEFFPVDDELYEEADEHHEKNKGKKRKGEEDEDDTGAGGCSYYITKWEKKHNDELKNLINNPEPEVRSERKRRRL